MSTEPSNNLNIPKQNPDESLESYVIRLQRELIIAKTPDLSIKAELSPVESLNFSQPPQILSPATSIEQPEFELNQPIAFINSHQDVIPGSVKSINRDGTYDLEVFVPVQGSEVKFNRKNASFKRKETWILNTQYRKRARSSDPRTIFRKQIMPLAEAQAGGGDGIVQTHYNVYQPVGKTLVPKFHDFHTSLIGTFFNPSEYIYKIWCWRPMLEIQGQQFPEEIVEFPKKEPFYFENFYDAFRRYFKEYYEGMSRNGTKWNQVKIEVFEKNSGEFLNLGQLTG